MQKLKPESKYFDGKQCDLVRMENSGELHLITSRSNNPFSDSVIEACLGRLIQQLPDDLGKFVFETYKDQFSIQSIEFASYIVPELQSRKESLNAPDLHEIHRELWGIDNIHLSLHLLNWIAGTPNVSDIYDDARLSYFAQYERFKPLNVSDINALISLGPPSLANKGKALLNKVKNRVQVINNSSLSANYSQELGEWLTAVFSHKEVKTSTREYLFLWSRAKLSCKGLIQFCNLDPTLNFGKNGSARYSVLETLSSKLNYRKNVGLFTRTLVNNYQMLTVEEKEKIQSIAFSRIEVSIRFEMVDGKTSYAQMSSKVRSAIKLNAKYLLHRASYKELQQRGYLVNIGCRLSSRIKLIMEGKLGDIPCHSAGLFEYRVRNGEVAPVDLLNGPNLKNWQKNIILELIADS
jgi:hypothetical protein